MDYVDINFRAIMVLLAVLNFILAFFAESVIVDYLVFIKLKEWLKEKTSSQTMYDKIYNQTKNTDWLPRLFNDDDIIFDTCEKGGDDMINSCQLHGSVRFNKSGSAGKLNGYTNTALINEDDHHGDGRITNQVEVLIDMNNRAKSSPSESGICIMSPVSAPVSPGSRSPTNIGPYNGSNIGTKPLYKSISNIPSDTNNQIMNSEGHSQSSDEIVMDGSENHGKHNSGFVRSDSLVLIDNQETRDEETDLKPILNGNSSDVLI